ncbi:MAG: YlxM family DNA-binding protein [Lachnospiraceae bacterium]|nr:YlxM family DNA-binding protein [Lachnospiraceae bacterium]
MDEILRSTLLFDFYGELLTEKQKTIFELFHLNDFSLTEIGNELNISRQAVRDQIKRTEKILLDYEEKLKLVEKFAEQKASVKRIKALVEEIEKEHTLDNLEIDKIEEIKKIADEILD